MKITKHRHAHLTLDLSGQKMIIDPGIFSDELRIGSDVSAVVVTHQHADHFNPKHLDTIRAANPNVVIYAPADVVAQYGHATLARVGETQQAGPFKLQFYGGTHAVIHELKPAPHNIGALVQDAFYYPGDSFTLPGNAKVRALAVPANAPWATVGQAMDFIMAIKPELAFPSHDGLLSDIGHTVYTDWLKIACKESGTTFRSLDPGDLVEI